MSKPDFDAIVVGASVAGCAAARLFAQRGARVALVERRPDLDAYKTVCTHYIQPSATPSIEKLGLAALIEEHGAVRNSIDLWTPYGGWIRHRGDVPYGYNVTRQVLDPLRRRMTAETPGVELLAGYTATELLGGGAGDPGVVVEDRQRARRALRGRLVVAADGRDTRVARMAGVKGRVRPHNRFFYWAYWRGVEPADGRSRMWFMEPDCAYTFPNEDGLCLLLAGPHRDRLPEFRDDLEGAYMRYMAALPDAPDLSHATRESKLLGKLDLPNVSRPAARPGLAFAGDAALASDPLWGVGCGWAFQSAEWLVEETADALVGGGDLDAALDSYRKVHRRRLGLHHFLISDLASARPANPLERAMYRSAVTDDEVYGTFEGIGSRRRSPATLFAPGTLARMARAG
jgi:flavin-dependent dehydrogenase